MMYLIMVLLNIRPFTSPAFSVEYRPEMTRIISQPHQSPRTRHQDGEGVWPGQEVVLGPPPLDDQTDVEAQHEGQGDVGEIEAAVQS